MSWEAWGDSPDYGESYTDERVEEAFRDGAAACREMMARFVEQSGDATTAASIRANWNPAWGTDPGAFATPIPEGPWS